MASAKQSGAAAAAITDTSQDIEAVGAEVNKATGTPANTATLNFGVAGSRFGAPLRQGDVTLMLGVVAILMVLIMPMLRRLLDFSLTISITFLVLVLMVTLFIARPIELSAFMTVLLSATMLRLALNSVATRLILANGRTDTQAAGTVDQAFSGFVMTEISLLGSSFSRFW